jgi:hypothetical protein
MAAYGHNGKFAWRSELENGHLSFDVHGRGALTNGQLRQLEGMVSEPGLANRLSNDEVVRVFEMTRLSEYLMRLLPRSAE